MKRNIEKRTTAILGKKKLQRPKGKPTNLAENAEMNVERPVGPNPINDGYPAEPGIIGKKPADTRSGDIESSDSEYNLSPLGAESGFTHFVDDQWHQDPELRDSVIGGRDPASRQSGRSKRGGRESTSRNTNPTKSKQDNSQDRINLRSHKRT